MPDIVPLYDVHLLRFRAEDFAAIAVTNAIWLTGEWLAQKPEPGEILVPEVSYILEPRCRDEALLTLDSLPEALRHHIFALSFMQRAHTEEHLFCQLALQHKDMLDEALRSEWQRLRDQMMSADRAVPSAARVANELLPRLARPR
jgi:hypothetical protein